MSANWDMLVIEDASEEQLNRTVSFAACLLDLGNGMSQEWRFTANNHNTYITYYMRTNLNRNVIIKIADDLVLARMEYLMKIYQGYERSQGKMNWQCAINLINEYLSETALLGEFEYRNFSGTNAWSAPRPHKDGQGFREGYKRVTGQRRDLLQGNLMPGYDWLFSNKLTSSKPCTRLESVYRARQQSLLFGKQIEKPKEWQYDEWRHDFLQQQGEKTMVEEHKPSDRWLICSFIGLINRREYREFRIRYTTEMMNFDVLDMEALIDNVHAKINAREEISEYKFMWACIRAAVNINNAKYLYALFQQGPEALDRFEDENMNETLTDWSESGPIENFYRYFNKTLHYQTKIPAKPMEKIHPEVTRSAVEFINQFKENGTSDGGSSDEHFKSHALTEADIYPGESSQSGPKESDVKQVTQEGQVQKGTKVEKTSEKVTSVVSAPEDKIVVLEKDMITKKSVDTKLEAKSSFLFERKSLSYAKVVQKSLPSANGSPRSESPKQGENFSESVTKLSEGKPEIGQLENQVDEKKEENASPWKQVGPKHNGNRSNNNKKNGGNKKNNGGPSASPPKQEPKKVVLPVTDDLKRRGAPSSKDETDTKEVSKKEVSKKVPNKAPVKNDGKMNNKKPPAASKKVEEPTKPVGPKEANLKLEKEEKVSDEKDNGLLAKEDMKHDSEPCSSNAYYLLSSNQEMAEQPETPEMPEEPKKPTKTALRKARKAAALLELQKSNSLESEAVVKLVMAADDKTAVEANFDVEVQELNKKKQDEDAKKCEESEKDVELKPDDIGKIEDALKNEDASKKENELIKEGISLKKETTKQNHASKKEDASKKTNESKGEDESIKKDQSLMESSSRKELTPVEAVFSDSMAALYVENAILTAQGYWIAPYAPAGQISSNAPNDAPAQKSDDTNAETDKYIPGQKITYDYRPEVYPDAADYPFDGSTTSEQTESVKQEELREETENDTDSNQPLATYDADGEKEIELANPDQMFPERTCDPDLHDMFRRLKFIYDKQSTGGLRNFNERKKNVVKKRLKTFMNVYIFRYRIAKAMLHILEQDIVADLSGMRERSVIRNLCGYIGEKVEEDSDTLRGRNLDRLTENIRLAGVMEGETIIRGLRYIDLRLSELDTTDPLHEQYQAISNRVYDLMTKQQTLVVYLGGSVDYRGYKNHN
ncbi:hypothetical protein CRE_00414 [Caenorhabditis remanei]|uniref:Uncharacterized protein n=1 Tax=Caenorhabditis remanei TaxID=31234 RepID=E3LCG4_CAERE|nr:hypothetical protein CRE_00414 [Caenorhabditis remanei]